jgi:hypothetical protein
VLEDDSQALRGVLSAMRGPGSEVQLTQALAAFASSDPAFAAALAECFATGASPKKRAMLGQFPAELRCDAELVLAGGRRVDLRFEDVTRRFGLLVELKIDAGYGHQQLRDYMSAADEFGYERVGLVAVTKSPPWYGEDAVSRTRGGSDPCGGPASSSRCGSCVTRLWATCGVGFCALLPNKETLESCS